MKLSDYNTSYLRQVVTELNLVLGVMSTTRSVLVSLGKTNTSPERSAQVENKIIFREGEQTKYH